MARFILRRYTDGEEIWFENAATVTFGQLLNYQTPNVQGFIPLLWSVSGSMQNPAYKMYDVFTVDWILDIANVSAGTLMYGSNGEILIYNLIGASNALTLWNSTKVLVSTMTDSWYYRPVGMLLDGRKGYEWNLSVPDMAGAQSIVRIKDGILYARATYSDGAPRKTKVGDDVNYDTIEIDSEGNYPSSINNL